MYPLWPMWFSVYASCILLCSRLSQSKLLATLRQIRNIRYGWLVKPYEIPILGFLPSGTFTLKEATSFACRTNAEVCQLNSALSAPRSDSGVARITLFFKLVSDSDTRFKNICLELLVIGFSIASGSGQFY